MTRIYRQRDTICPSWCQLPPAHIAGLGGAGGTTHRRVVREIRLDRIEAIREAAEAPVRVEVEAYSDPEGREHPPTVRLTVSGASSPDDPDADDLTPAEARDLAAALLEAARLAESLSPAPRQPGRAGACPCNSADHRWICAARFSPVA